MKLPEYCNFFVKRIYIIYMCMRFLFLSLLLVTIVFAQREVYTARANQDSDHPWTNSYSSERFTVWYGTAADCAALTETQAKTAADELEKIFDVYLAEGFNPPYAANATKYKMGAYVLRNGSNCTNAPNHTCGTTGTAKCCGGTTTCSEGHAFGGTIGSPRAPGMWLAAGAVSDNWALAHEFMHGLQQMAGGMSGGTTNSGTNFTGWFHESHANLMPHMVYPTGTTGVTNGVHYCAEMYTRTPHLYLGSTRNRYCNWQFFEYLMHRGGTKIVNDIWLSGSPDNVRDPFSEVMRRNNLTQSQFGDWFGDFATKAVIWDLNKHTVANTPSVNTNTAYAGRNNSRFRSAWNSGTAASERNRRNRYVYLEPLDSNNAADNRYVSPFATAPQRYGFNIIRLYPATGTSFAAGNTVTVKFRGDVQTSNNISNYAKNRNLEGAVAHVQSNPGSDWRYSLVAVTGDATGTAANVSARYVELKQASDCSPDASITMQSGETQLYLVVAATPTVHHRISWDQFYHTIYRFPYMVEIDGAKPEGFQTYSNPTGSTHSNGGGFVANAATVAATAFVGPNARVTGGTVSGTARIEGRARVTSGTVSGSAVVKDQALVAGGTVTDRAVVSNQAAVFKGQISGDAKVHGAALIDNNNARISGNAQVGGVVLIDNATILSGTAQLLGDGEVYDITASDGVYFGLVDAGVINNAQHKYTAVPTEVTKPRSMEWNATPAGQAGNCNIAPPSSSSSQEVPTNIIASFSGAQFFNLNNRGAFSWGHHEKGNLRLKIFDARGKLLKSVELHGAQGVIDISLNTTQILLWRVENYNGNVIEQTKIGFFSR